MSEGTKTACFWGVALVALGVAGVAAWPRTSGEAQRSFINQPLFPEFTDPLAATSLEIITFDEEEGRPEKFEVGKQDGSELWTIKSHGGYPADAFEQMRDAATALVGLKILDVQTSNAEDHDDLGVVEPNLEKLQSGDVGIGRLVSFRDASNDRLASLVIGDPVKDEAEKRYVRIPGQDPVYVVKLDESHLTTSFRRWIEDDLLLLSSIEIGGVEIQDYLATPAQTRFVRARNYTADIGKDGSDWFLERLLEFDPNDEFIEPTIVKVDDPNDLNTTRLNEMADALDDLKIVDVVRKPEGMNADLSNSKELAQNKNALASLGQRGFFPQFNSDGGFDIYSANGELHVTLNDGVRYIMRFGNIAGLSESEMDGEGESGPEVIEAGVNRYLLVTTDVDESMFPIPQLKSIPQSIEELKKSLGVVDGASQAAEDAGETESGPEGDASETADEGSDSEVEDSEETEFADDENQMSEEEWQERLEAEQEIITKQNQRLMDERKDKLATAEERVAKLNARFADWYYVIPEETFAKLRIKRNDLLQSSGTGNLNVAPKFDFPGL